MNILHTSDWHLGQNLMFKDRKTEHQSFLEWLIKIIKNENINLLIIAGDIFDTGTPPNYALEMYYSFLVLVANIECCNDVIVIGGNHDSVSTLNAPKEILSFLNVHVIGGAKENLDDEIVVTKNNKNNISSIVCAVPFLSDRDIRKSVAGESYQEKSQKLMEGIKFHYEQVLIKAKKIKGNKDIPLLATGHLFAAGGEASEGVREIYVGSLGGFNTSWFPTDFDYIALGHLHKPQLVGKNKYIRYSGTPIPMSFSEANNIKQVIKLSFPDKEIKEIPIPSFRTLKRIKGTFKELEDKLNNLKELDEEIWLDISVEDNEFKGDLNNYFQKIVENSKIVIFKIYNLNSGLKKQLSSSNNIQSLDNLSVIEVFKKRIEAEPTDYTIEEQDELIQMFNEMYNDIDK